MARTDTATLLAAIESLKAEIETLKAAPAAPAIASEASAHYVARDIPCPVKGAKCVRDGEVVTFRTAKGAAWHKANVKH